MATEVTPRKAVRKHLLDDPAVAALVGDRIYYQTRPDGAAYPLIVLNTISSVDERDLAGVAFTRTRIQVTAMAATLVEAERIALAVRNSLEGYTGLMAGVLRVIDCQVGSFEPVYQDEVDQTHYHVDLLIMHAE